MNKADTRKLGKKAEDIAEKFLKEKGYEILQRNYQFGHGEIDIIAKDGDVLVFVEVKSRSDSRFGDPEYALSYPKQKMLVRSAHGYLYEKNIDEVECRFDLVAIKLYEGKEPEINHIESAFISE